MPQTGSCKRSRTRVACDRSGDVATATPRTWLLFSDTGELVLNDFHAAALTRTRIGRTFAHRLTPALQHRVARRIAARNGRDDVVVVDIATGQEKARAVVPSVTQSLVLPAPGFNRDLYWCTLTTLARISVATPL
jgi:hypothetical protein